MTNEPTGLPATTLGKRIRFLRTQAQLTQDDLAGRLNVTRQALSNWERDINLPDLDLLEKICTIFGIHMDELIRGAMNMELNMEAGIQNENLDNNTSPKSFFFNKYDLAIGLFYAIGIVLGVGIFFVIGLMTMTANSWAAALFAGGCTALIFGLSAHAIITLTRKDR